MDLNLKSWILYYLVEKNRQDDFSEHFDIKKAGDKNENWIYSV